MPTKDVATFPERKSLERVKSELAILVGLTMAVGMICAQGDVLGQITSSGYGRRRSRSLVTGTPFGTGSPTGTVADGTLFKAGDVLTNSAGANVGTVQSIAGNTITLTGNAAVAVATGAAVLASDGSQTAKAIADEGSDGVGETSIGVFIAGPLDESLIGGLDSSAKQELGGRSTIGGIFIF